MVGMDSLYDRTVTPGPRLPDFRERAPWLGGDLQSLRNFLRRPVIDLGSSASERIILPLDDRSGDRASAVLH